MSYSRRTLPNCRPATRFNYDATLDLFEELCKPKTLAGVNERTLSAFVAAMRKLPAPKRGKTAFMASTIHVRLALLQGELSWAAGQKLIAAVPRFPEVKVPKKRSQPVPAEVVERLLGKAPDATTHAYLLCGWLAGMHRNEAAALEWDTTDKAPYIDLHRDRIVFPGEFVKAAEDQWVPLDPKLREALLALPRTGDKVFAFTDPQGRPLGPSGISNRVERLARRAGVRLTYRSLRRGFGCRYASKVSAHVLQRLMRHSNITMTYYANIDDAVEAAVLGEQRNTSRNNSPQTDKTESARNAPKSGKNGESEE